jgi:hypothetical protein
MRQYLMPSLLDYSAVVRVTPEGMTKLLGLPEGNNVLWFHVVAGVLHCLINGPLMPEYTGGDLELLTVDDIMERKAKAVRAVERG